MQMLGMSVQPDQPDLDATFGKLGNHRVDGHGAEHDRGLGPRTAERRARDWGSARSDVWVNGGWGEMTLLHHADNAERRSVKCEV